jgi:signal transduction histidine kinase
VDIALSQARLDSAAARKAIRLLVGVAAAIVCGALLYGVALSIAAPALGPQRPVSVTLVMLVCEGAVLAAAALAARSGEPVALRRSWRLFACGAGAAVLGLISQLAGWSLPAVTLQGLHYALFLAALLYYPPPPSERLDRMELSLDLAFALVIAGIGLGYVFLGPNPLSPGVVVTWSYVLGDALLIGVVFAMLSRTWEPLARLSTVALALSFGLVTVADICYARFVQGTVSSCPGWVEGVWFLGQGCLVWAGVCTLRWRGLQAVPREQQVRMEGAIDGLAMALRVAIVIAAVGVLLRQLNWVLLAARGPLLIAGALLLLALLAARYALLRLQNERLTRELHAAAAQLQGRVEERTQELGDRMHEVQQLRAEAERRADEQAALLDTAALVNTSLRLDEVLDTLVRKVAELFEADGVALYMYDAEEQTLTARASFTPILNAEQLEFWKHIPLNQSPAAADVVRTKRPLLIPDAYKNHRIPPSLVNLGIQCTLVLPLLFKDRLLGVLIMDSREINGFNEHDAELAMALAQHATTAMENARLYEELAHSLEELQRTQGELVRSQRLEGLAQMVAGAAHELNNPLTVVQGYSELLLRQEISPQMRSDVERILQAIERSRQVVAALLAFGQREPLQRRATDVNQVLERTISLCQFDLDAAGVRVERRLDPSLPAASADPALLRQVFFNIILNARQAMSDGRTRSQPGEGRHGGRLTVRSRVNGSCVRVEISDDGTGIAPEIMDRIFDPFFTTRPTGQGMGLGLSLCFGIVNGHGGRIWALSPALQQYADGAGPGATLVVELPILEGEVD